MFKKFLLKSFGVIVSIIFIFGFFTIQQSIIFSLPANSAITLADFKAFSDKNTSGKYLTTSLVDNINVDSANEKGTKLIVKLFGFLPVKEIPVSLIKEEAVFLGGIPLGFAVKSKGVIVVGDNSITTDEGTTFTKKSDKIKSGDIIYALNDISVENENDILNVLGNCDGKEVKVGVLRDNKKFDVIIKPELDSESGNYKLGLWVRNDASGIGTLTFVNMSNDRFGALGHAITDFETGIEIPIEDGDIYNCNLLGIKKGKNGTPGELRCLFMQGKNSKGKVEKNSKYGVFGKITDAKGVIDENLTSVIASRINVKPGKASLISSVSGVREEYEIEIIKTNYQPKSSDKSFVFRVKDKRLLSLTGGIVQGMSGSPIVQDGKLVGAVTHVFISDSTKGYGVYTDWMILE